MAVAGLFVCVDASFVAANFVKFFDGGWIPILAASLLFFVMSCWAEGYAAMKDALERDTYPLADFIPKFHDKPRVAGTAVYLTSRTDVVPVALLHNLKHNKVIHSRIALLNVTTSQVPRVDGEHRIDTKELPDNFHALIARYGFMEQPDIPAALTTDKGDCALDFNLMDTSFFVGRLSISPSGPSRWHRLKMAVFKFLHRNALPATEFFRIPAGRVVELGSQVEV